MSMHCCIVATMHLQNLMTLKQPTECTDLYRSIMHSLEKMYYLVNRDLTKLVVKVIRFQNKYIHTVQIHVQILKNCT